MITPPPEGPARRRFRVVSVRALQRLAVLFTVIAFALVLAWAQLINMPGRSHTGPLPLMTDAQTTTASRLRADVEVLAGEHPHRHVFNPLRYAAAAAFLESRLAEAGLTPTRESFVTEKQRAACTNIIAEITGVTAPDEIVIVGAHYDSYMGMPGADDNASGVACLLALAQRLATEPHDRTLRLVCFANEEPPHFMTNDMGSHIHAFASKERGENIRLVISLEMLGCYDDTPGSQYYPPPLDAFYPDTGNFVAIVGNVSSRAHVRRLVGTWRGHIPFPCVGAALPSSIPGVAFSDHWSFWQAGYPAVMVTDTAFYRNDTYHTIADRPDTLDYDRMARVVDGLERLVRNELNQDS